MRLDKENEIKRNQKFAVTRKAALGEAEEMPGEQLPKLQRRHRYSAAKVLFDQETLSSSAVLRYVTEEVPIALVE
jgi:hypothetical protein